MLDIGGSRSGVDFDQNGPRIGSFSLLTKTSTGFRPRPAEDLAGAVSDECAHIVAFPRLEGALTRIAAAMNAGDLALAAIATCQLSADASRMTAFGLSKAASDDPHHPGYPAGEPDGKGGQFRPKDQGHPGDITAAALVAPREKTDRLAQRRSIRSALKRVLAAKRLLRLLGENAVAALTEEIPGLDVLTTGAAIEDDLALVKDLKDAIAGTGAALELAEQGAVDLESLQVSGDNVSFETFEDFKKIELERVYGKAGDGLDYHHLVEQGPNAGHIAPRELQSTGNIVRLPRLIHEEINSIYATPQTLDGVWQTPRDFLRGKTFEEQKDFAIGTLRKMGVVK